ncbi:hypothetical protein [Persephonella sp. KM09-Lau-8]|uniref:hypothetical protein n=1 Tax=Persephonella sp. KM09-Lau-8 TaxID=1158345 RepID=UPI0004956795|nr:hypothetical protein [Persephonella sp. KM09-Lau-8]
MPLTIDKETMEKHPLYKDGIQEGIQKGKLEAQKEAILNLHKELNLEPEKISKILKVPLSFVKDVLNKGD